MALHIEGYRWVEWNHRALGGAPLDEPGCFIGHPGDPQAHLYVDAVPEADLHAHPYARLPRYSSEIGPALRAAERAGLFRDPGVQLSCSSEGVWHLSRDRGTAAFGDGCLPRLLARAALAMGRDSQGPRSP